MQRAMLVATCVIAIAQLSWAVSQSPHVCSQFTMKQL